MLSLLLLILSVGLSIVKQNGFLIISNWVIYLCFGLTGLSFLGNTIGVFAARNQINKISRRFK